MSATTYWTFVFVVTLCGGTYAYYSFNPVVQVFQKYLQINTTTGNNLAPAVNFWKRLAGMYNLPINVYEFVEGFPVIVIKWKGMDSSLRSIMLNSHMDVVPANEEDGWNYPPFSGYIDKNNNIYGRGAQDMKSVSIMHFIAMVELKAKYPFLRDVYMVIQPDEEIGGMNGMISFLRSKVFAAMNVGLALDESTPYPSPVIIIFYQDKASWHVQVDCHASPAHGSIVPARNETAIGKCLNVMNRFMKFREEQYQIIKEVSILNSGVYTSINLNKIHGGETSNVIPPKVSLLFDIRLATSIKEKDFEAQLRKWVSEAGDNITLTFKLKNRQSPATITNASNPHWTAIVDAVNKFNLTILPIVSPGSTDVRYVRSFGIPAFGISPLFNTPIRAHSVNEYLNAEVFLCGIDIFVQILRNIANTCLDDKQSNYLYKTVN